MMTEFIKDDYRREFVESLEVCVRMRNCLDLFLVPQPTRASGKFSKMFFCLRFLQAARITDDERLHPSSQL